MGCDAIICYTIGRRNALFVEEIMVSDPMGEVTLLLTGEMGWKTMWI